MNVPSWIWKRPTFWQWNFAGWTGVGILFFTRLVLHLPATSAVWLALFQTALSLVFTILMRAVYRRLSSHYSFSVGTAAGIIAVSLVATTIQSTAALWLISFTGWRNPYWTPYEEWLLRFIFFWLLYMVWSLLYFWLKAERESRALGRKAEEAAAEAQRLELQMLRAQLDPHFLFNALNGAATLISTNAGAASTMVRELADYLRYSLDHRQDMTVPLSLEMDALDAYLKVEQARFGDELSVSNTLSPAALQRVVPCFLLQPLVENAVKHSFRTSSPPWQLSIQGELQNDELRLEVHNTGVLEDSPRQGVGLENLRRRLALLYPDRHQLELRQHGECVCALLILKGEPCSA